MKKRFLTSALAILIALASVMSLASCDKNKGDEQASDTTPVTVTEAPTEPETDAPTEAPTAAPTEAPTEAATTASTTVSTEAPTDAEKIGKSGCSGVLSASAVLLVLLGGALVLNKRKD